MCVCACVRACVRACVCVCVFSGVSQQKDGCEHIWKGLHAGSGGLWSRATAAALCMCVCVCVCVCVSQNSKNNDLSVSVCPHVQKIETVDKTSKSLTVNIFIIYFFHMVLAFHAWNTMSTRDVLDN